MNKNKIISLLEQIDSASIVIVNDSPMLQWVDVSDPIGDPENEVLYVNWHDDEGNKCVIKFTEAGLNEAVIDGYIVRLQDHEGDDCAISLLKIEGKDVENDWK